MLPTDTQAIVLFCASFGQDRQTEPKPLNLREYNLFASWLHQQELTPADILDRSFQEKLPALSIAKLDPHRILALLDRGFLLGLAVEKWLNQGLWIIGRGEEIYPKRLKQKLKHLAPPILYGIGDRSLLSLGGLAIVGSRNADAEGLHYTQQVARECVKEGVQVISGGARGVDRAAMIATLESAGTVIGVLADSLARMAVHKEYRNAIREGKLVLISSYDPEAGFSIGNAMGRNKYIYSLADRALVVSATEGQGGTWAGAIEALEKFPEMPVFVRLQGNISEGNRKLQEIGAKPYPFPSVSDAITESIAVGNSEPIPPTAIASIIHKTAYEAVLPVMLQYLNEPKDLKSLVTLLDVSQSQLQKWLDRSIQEGKVKKNKKPITYEINKPETLPLLELTR
jgi:predicted Rossmann fold nucleotide-binding protein DprA/Smf involved in DNA uptake